MSTVTVTRVGSVVHSEIFERGHALIFSIFPQDKSTLEHKTNIFIHKEVFQDDARTSKFRQQHLVCQVALTY